MNLFKKDGKRSVRFCGGVKVSFNEAHPNVDVDFFSAVEAYQKFEYFDEASQVRLVRRFFTHIQQLFFRDVQDVTEPCNRGCERQLSIVAPKARTLLAPGLPEGILPDYQSPPERLAWYTYIGTPGPVELQNKVVKLRGLTFNKGHIFPTAKSLARLTKLGLPNEGVYDTARRLAQEAAEKLKSE